MRSLLVFFCHRTIFVQVVNAIASMGPPTVAEKMQITTASTRPRRATFSVRSKTANTVLLRDRSTCNVRRSCRQARVDTALHAFY